MDTGVIVAIIVIVALLIIGAVWYFAQQKRKSDQLRRDFGPEYDRTLEGAGSRGDAERELEERRKRVEGLKLRELPRDQQAGYAEEWRAVEARFVDDPAGTLDDADRVARRLMADIGYPMSDPDKMAADLSVGHSGVVEHYRMAHATMQKGGNGEATTEDVRQAMIHYRTVVDELLPNASIKREDAKDGSSRTQAEMPQRKVS
jgi:hypothetical protein